MKIYLPEDARKGAVNEIKIVGDNVIFAHAAVTSRSVAQVGCTVAVSYTIEG